MPLYLQLETTPSPAVAALPSCVSAFWRVVETVVSVLCERRPSASLHLHRMVRCRVESYSRVDGRERVLCRRQVARDLVARGRGRSLPGEQSLRDDADGALCARDGVLGTLYACGRRSITIEPGEKRVSEMARISGE